MASWYDGIAQPAMFNDGPGAGWGRLSFGHRQAAPPNVSGGSILASGIWSRSGHWSSLANIPSKGRGFRNLTQLNERPRDVGTWFQEPESESESQMKARFGL
jgi:hypothetical protein